MQEAGWAPRPVWTGAENLTVTEIRYPDRPARSQSLYRLRYPAHTHFRRTVQYSALPVDHVFHPAAVGSLSEGKERAVHQGTMEVQFKRGVAIWVD